MRPSEVLAIHDRLKHGVSSARAEGLETVKTDKKARQIGNKYAKLRAIAVESVPQ